MSTFTNIAQRTPDDSTVTVGHMSGNMATVHAATPFEHGKLCAARGLKPRPSFWYRKLAQQLEYMCGYLVDETVLSDANFQLAESIYDNLLDIAEAPDCERCTDWRI